MRLTTKTSLTIGAAMILHVPAFAQEAVEETSTDTETVSTGSTEDTAAAAVTNAPIIVTAQRREETLQRVPVAVTALSGEGLTQIGVSDIAGLAPRVPSFTMGTQVGGAKINIRGIGLDTLAAGAEAPIAFHQDGVFIQRTAPAAAGFFDVERVEVLRGPQGTLYGRNATGGAVNVITRDPTATLEGYFRVAVGNYDLFGTEGAISGPLAEGVRGRVAFRTSDRDGFGTNIVTGNDIDDQSERAFRAKLELLPTDRLTILLAGDYTWAEDNNAIWHYLGQGGPAPMPLGVVFGGELPNRLRDVAWEHDPIRDLEAWGISSTISYEFDFATFRSITAYRETDLYGRFDLDATSFQLFSPMNITENAHQFSQELQLSGTTGRADWVVGLFHFHEDDDGFMDAPVWNGLFVPPATAFVSQGYYAGSYIETDAQAIFGQLTYRFTDELSATVGARYSTERKSVIDQQSLDLFTPVVDPTQGAYNPAVGMECSEQIQSLPAVCDPSRRWSAFTPKVGLEYQAAPDVLLYASATKGFRSGNYSLGAVQAPVDPEYIWSYEFGLKSQLFDNRLQANLATFLYDYTDLQVTKAAGTQTVVENAATASVFGIEAEIVANLTPNFRLDFVGSYLDATFDSYVSADPARPAGDGMTTDNGVPAFDLSGNRLPQAPEFSFLAGAQYTADTNIGSFTLRGEVSHSSTVYFSPFNRPEVSVGPRTRLNAYLNFLSIDERWTASLVGRNLTNKRAPTDAFVTTALVGFAINGNIEEPRTFALQVGYNF